MLYPIRNADLTVEIQDLGAELTRVTNQADGYEYLWSGDPSIWSGHSPLLFPIVGKLRDQRYTYGGQTYTLPKHGFARRSLFRCERTGATSLTMVLDDWAAHADAYPFRWALRVSFSLEGRTLTVRHEVENLDDAAPLLFSIGAHPAIACKDGVLVFPQPETIDARQFGPDGLIAEARTPFLRGETRYPLLPHTFDRDAYILEGLRSPYVDVHSAATPHWTRVHFGGAPYVGIWAKPGAPYVCIEPWEGLDDSTQASGAFDEKEGIVSLPARQTHTFSISLDFS